ncbi:hypothetical protein MWU58_06855 [Flavobacteriaceae bacterium S0825]|uniref:hypothetical protein n=1 Tax=Gaetbulibacter sp. S0825 TaxID=2720084 RepID=UPI00142F4629|nr:hypothetical protein [Gaetbulibacter sp. S0825]MCK0109005.1 hypothetical protein [Flavobacteriaceae bacterium S0825]NIX64640.1 hypothetical protein [Gaetbulibacter sp. S0825]
MFNIFIKSYPDPVNAETLKSILNNVVSPIMKEINLEWNNNYQWIGPLENGMRKVVCYQVGKGLMGIFIWGICYEFLPMLSGKRIITHRTFKSARLQLFENSVATNDFQNDKSDIENGISTTWGKKQCEKSIKLLISKTKDDIYDWLDQASTIEGSLIISNQQILSEDYNLHWPNPKYIAAFLYAKKGHKEKGLAFLKEIQNERLNLEKDLFSKIEKRLVEL